MAEEEQKKQKQTSTSNRKRRGRGEGGVRFCAERRLWVGTLSLGVGGAANKRLRRRVYAPTKKECLEKLSAERARLGSGAVPGAASLTAADAVRRWLAVCTGALPAATVEPRRMTCEKWLLPLLGESLKLQKVTPLHVEDVYARAARGGIGRGAMRNLARCLRAAMGYAARVRLVDVSPAAEVRVPALPAAPPRAWLTAQQVGLVTAAADGAGGTAGTLVRLALATGCRMGELLALRWPDVEVVEGGGGKVHVRRAIAFSQAGGLVEKEPKTLAGRRTVTVDHATARALERHRRAQEALGLLAAPVFCTRGGGHLERTNVLRSLRCIVARVNDPDRASRKGGRGRKAPAEPVDLGLAPADLRFHELRHAHASVLLSAGCSVRAVSARLGHSNPAFTLARYGHVMPADDAALALAAAAVMGG